MTKESTFQTFPTNLRTSLLICIPTLKYIQMEEGKNKQKQQHKTVFGLMGTLVQ